MCSLECPRCGYESRLKLHRLRRKKLLLGLFFIITAIIILCGLISEQYPELKEILLPDFSEYKIGRDSTINKYNPNPFILPY